MGQGVSTRTAVTTPQKQTSLPCLQSPDSAISEMRVSDKWHIIFYLFVWLHWADLWLMDLHCGTRTYLLPGIWGLSSQIRD